jgi:hypothetical protein
MREWRYSSTILDLGTRWRWVFSFALRPLYFWWNIKLYPLDRRLSGYQDPCEHCGEEKNLTPAENGTPVVKPVACCHADWATPTSVICTSTYIQEWIGYFFFHEQWTACKILVGRYCIIHHAAPNWPQTTTACLGLWKMPYGCLFETDFEIMK